MNTKAALSIVHLALLTLTSAATADDAAIGRKIDEHLRQREQQGFSGVFLITRHGETILNAAYGFRDAEAKAPMRATDAFDIGSITKPITRLAILKLEAEGRLSTTDLISKHFDDVPEDKQAITIRHVLDHKAGFPDYFGDDYELITRDELRRQLFQAPLIAPVGERSIYSNNGYSLLAMMIERASGMPYEEYVHESLLAPAGTPRIGYVIPHFKREELAVGHRSQPRRGQPPRRFGTPLEHPWYGDGPSWHLRGNGGMLASARELHDFFLAIEHNPDVLPEAVRANRPRRYGAFGGNGFFNAGIFRNRDLGITIIGMSNDGSHPAEDSFEQIIEWLEE